MKVDNKQPQKQLNSHTIKRWRYYTQQGFTLIELMVSLVLGLLISAAVMQVYFISTKTSVIQSSGADITDANIFGLQAIEERIKLTNLGLATNATGVAIQGGVVVDKSTNLSGINLAGGGAVSDGLVTRDGADTPASGSQWTGKSNTNALSDQLTIQYRAPQDTYDCEGRLALGPRRVDVDGVSTLIDGQIIIERYFLRQSGDNLVLACDAGRYITEVMDDYAQQGKSGEPTTVFTQNNQIKNFGDAGQELITNIDDFQVLLGVQTASGIQYVTSSYYIDVSNGINNLPIVAVKIGAIIRGNVALPSTEEGTTNFNLLGNTVDIKSTEPQNMIRRVYESNIMLRNARQL